MNNLKLNYLNSIVMLLAFLMSFNGCSNISFSIRKCKIDKFASENLILTKKQNFIQSIIENPDKAQEIIKSSEFYDSAISETFFILDAHYSFETENLVKFSDVIFNTISKQSFMGTFFNTSETFIIGLDYDNWEYFHEVDYILDEDSDAKLFVTFVLRDKKWYFVSLTLTNLYR